MKHVLVLRHLSIPVLLSVSILACSPGLPSPGDGSSGGASGPVRVEGGYRFQCYFPKASKVVIVGDFNGWSTGADPMFDRGGKGLWSIVLPLEPGRYEYKFLADGEKWFPDPGNPERVKDGFGGYNSVITVGP